MALPCLIGTIWFSVALVIYPIADKGAGVVLLWLAAIGLLGLLTAMMVRYALRVGAWFHVDGTGMRYGEGPAGQPRETSAEIRVDWHEIVAKPELAYDVQTRSSGGPKSLTRDLVFWRRLPSGDVVQHYLPLRLSLTGTSCLRYRNRHELLRAVLQGLAARPGLRFDAGVFVDAGIDPVTWEPMNGPRRATWWPVLSTAVALFFLAREVGPTWSPWQLAVATMAIMAVCMGFCFRGWTRTYADLTGVIAYRAKD
jgi:hypothetical protein